MEYLGAKSQDSLNYRLSERDLTAAKGVSDTEMKWGGEAGFRFWQL